MGVAKSSPPSYENLQCFLFLFVTFITLMGDKQQSYYDISDIKCLKKCLHPQRLKIHPKGKIPLIGVYFNKQQVVKERYAGAVMHI